MKLSLAYVLAALLLGAAWYGALLIPEATRDVLLLSGGGSGGYRVVWALLVCAVSVALALVFRRQITGARGALGNFMLGILLPLVGAYLFTWGNLLVLVVTPSGGREPIATVLQTLLLYPFFAVYVIARGAFYIFVPMGVASQLIMRKMGTPTRGPASGRSDPAI